MKTICILLFCTVMFLGYEVSAQGMPPPPPTSYGQSGDSPPGGGAPIGSGIALLLTLAAAYGGKKMFAKPVKSKELL